MENAVDFFNSFARDTELCIMGMLDLEGRFVHCNRGLQRLLGAGEAVLDGESLSGYFRLDPRASGESLPLSEWLKGREHHTLECDGTSKSGSPFSARLFLSVLRDGEGIQRGFGIIVENLTPKMKMESAIRQSEERFKKAFSAAPDGMVISRLRDGKVMEANEGWQQISGYSREETIGESSRVMDLMDPQEREKAIGLLVAEGRIRDMEIRIRAKSGSLRNVMVSAEKLDLDGEDCLMTILRDVTELKNTILNLEKSEFRNRSLLEALPDAIFQFDGSGKCADFKPGQDAQTDAWPIEGVVGKDLKEIFPAKPAALLVRNHAKALKTGKVQVCEFPMVHPNETRELEARCVPFGRESLLLLLRDITGSRNLERLAASITSREQRRLGGELHDGICQELTGISFLCKSLEAKLAPHGPGLQEPMEEISRLLGDCILHTRALITGLYPEGLERGLAGALRELIGKLGKVYPSSFSFLGEDQNLGQDVSAHLYLIAQEAAGNAARHGNAGSIHIYLGGQGDNLVLKVSDDGRGISADRKGSEGRGTDIMHYRARLIGARLEIQSREGKGTTVSCILPSSLAYGFKAA
ncbi:MAG TPA: PAS domain S-box protein [Fibrobacteria bacterium]|nr:PAS domain S-box protein [Fibrobacteria bacterium]